MKRSMLLNWMVAILFVACVSCTGLSGVGSDSVDGTSTSSASTLEETIDSQGETEIGIIVNKPRPPSLNLFPDFESYIPATALSVSTEGATGLRMLTAESETRVFDPANAWNAFFVNGGIADARESRKSLESLGIAVAETISQAGITEITEDLQTTPFTLENALLGSSTEWSVEMRLESDAGEYVRFYFRDAASGLLVATYVVKINTENQPVKGLFAFVNASLLQDDADSGLRVLSLAFDFANADGNLLVTREERYHDDLLSYYVYQTHQQCSSVNADCVGEYLEITTEAPNRENLQNDIRFSWNEATQAICLGAMDYATHGATSLTTFGFVNQGGALAAEDDITENSCTFPTAYWNGHTFTPDNLLLRFEDTEPHAGTGMRYYVDGLSKTGWDALTPELIDTWLDATKF